jgi:hypothetical protein
MSGDGSAENPYIVMDGFDFNALRNISSSSTSFKYVELGADIQLDMYASFTPIPECFFNIEGNNHSIIDFYISGAKAGLFANLHTESLTNLIIEGQVTGTSTGAYATDQAGTLAATITGRGANISNIQCFGTVTGKSAGGMAGVLGDDSYAASSITGATTSLLNCAFQGTINFAPLYVSTTLNSSTPYCGGLIGQLYVTSHRNNFTIKNCMVRATIILTSNGGITIAAGIFGCTYYGRTEYANSIMECVVQVVFIVNGTGSASNATRYGGLIGYFTPYQNDTQINSFTGENSAVHSKIVLNTATILMAGGLANTQTSAAVYGRTSISTSYAVIELQDNGNDTANVHIDGVSRSAGYIINNCFWDREKLEATYTKYAGSYVYPGKDTTTENLKSRVWLAAQGWDI